MSQTRYKTKVIYQTCKTDHYGQKYCVNPKVVEDKTQPIKGVEVPILGEIIPPPPFGLESYGDMFWLLIASVFFLKIFPNPIAIMMIFFSPTRR
ncbi:hypothetical protein ACSYAD_26005 [Acaryochloris marina NIES-2412]|uniref:hypothetical protein n=1 Tax=Acaryochloris marina TaxID=155978 RepID=UPI004059901E